MLERDFQKNLMVKLQKLFPGAFVFKSDAFRFQGFPDVLILYGQRWAGLECKASENAPHRPNQDYYVEHMNNESFARFIYPENEETVIAELKEYFGQ